MNRRDAVLALVALGATPLRANAQQSKLPKIGVLTLGQSTIEKFPQAFRAGLRDRGYVEGQNILIETRTVDLQGDRANALARELVQLKPDVIVAAPTQAVQAVKNATGTIPIVMVAADPVVSGFVASLAHPERNLTGVSTLIAELGPKLLGFLKELQPGISRVAVLVNPANTIGPVFLERIQSSSGKLGVRIQPLFAQEAKDLPAAFAAMAKERAEAVILQPILAGKAAADLAIKHRLPSITTGLGGNFPEFGGLMIYGANLASAYRQCAGYVDRILKGAKPADLPVEQPTQFEMAINLKTARALGLKIPQSMLLRVDRVIE